MKWVSWIAVGQKGLCKDVTLYLGTALKPVPLWTLLSSALKPKKLNFFIWKFPNLPCCAVHRACALETSANQAGSLPAYTNLNGDKIFANAVEPNELNYDSETSNFPEVVILRKMYPLFYRCFYHKLNLMGGSLFGPPCITLWYNHYKNWLQSLSLFLEAWVGVAKRSGWD